MPLDLRRLLQLRPYLYHLTAQRNFAQIKASGELRCTAQLLIKAQMQGLSRTRRKEHLLLNTGVLVRDQTPLAAGAVRFEEGWDLERFVAHVNEHVFFWPGTATKPIQAGLNHFSRYAHESPVILRIEATPDLLASCRFSRYNSGAPRCSGGQHSPRGSRTYLEAGQFPGTASEVVEVVSPRSVPLPNNTMFSSTPYGPWAPVASAA